MKDICEKDINKDNDLPNGKFELKCEENDSGQSTIDEKNTSSSTLAFHEKNQVKDKNVNTLGKENTIIGYGFCRVSTF